MALIKCSNCGSEISDKALQCPKCGVTIVEDNSEQIEKACVKCEECGKGKKHVLTVGVLFL